MTNKLDFAYGPSGLIGFAYSGQFYAFHKNILGDIVALYCDRLLVTQYRYDAWGNCQVLTASGLADTNPSSPGNLNPFRYRGAYFDAYSNLYLMGARPYDPDTGRFICPDDPAYLDPASLDGLNLYAYCLNNPVTYTDATGHFAVASFLIGLGVAAGIGALVGGTAYAISEGVSYTITGEWSWSWGQFVGSVLGGALGGALAFISPAAPAALIGGLTGFSSTAFGMLLQNQWEGTGYSTGQIIMTSLVSGLVSAGTTALSNTIRIPGLNSGRNSYSAISKQIVTKFRNGTISRITYSTFSKMLTLNLMGNVIGSTVSGVVDAFNVNDWMVKHWFGGF